MWNGIWIWPRVQLRLKGEMFAVPNFGNERDFSFEKKWVYLGNDRTANRLFHGGNTLNGKVSRYVCVCTGKNGFFESTVIVKSTQRPSK